MAARDMIVDLSTIDRNQVVADIDEIRKYNRQRFEMEQLTAIVYEDSVQHVCIGYKDVSLNEIWVRGHMPGMPIMPGVVMCEAAAQLSSYHAQKQNLLGADVVGLGGLEEVRFRGAVVPGDRLYVICQLVKVRRGGMIVCRFQGIVDDQIVVEGVIKGVPLPVEQLARLATRKTGP